jgi:hypothetical protein
MFERDSLAPSQVRRLTPFRRRLTCGFRANKWNQSEIWKINDAQLEIHEGCNGKSCEYLPPLGSEAFEKKLEEGP